MERRERTAINHFRRSICINFGTWPNKKSYNNRRLLPFKFDYSHDILTCRLLQNNLPVSGISQLSSRCHNRFNYIHANIHHKIERIESNYKFRHRSGNEGMYHSVYWCLLVLRILLALYFADDLYCHLDHK